VALHRAPPGWGRRTRWGHGGAVRKCRLNFGHRLKAGQFDVGHVR